MTSFLHFSPPLQAKALLSPQSSQQQSPLFPSLTHSTLMSLQLHKRFPACALYTDSSPNPISHFPSKYAYFPPPNHILHTMKKHCFLATRLLCSLASCAFTCETQTLLVLLFLLQEETPVSISGQFTWSSCFWVPTLWFHRVMECIALEGILKGQLVQCLKELVIIEWSVVTITNFRN